MMINSKGDDDNDDDHRSCVSFMMEIVVFVCLQQDPDLTVAAEQGDTNRMAVTITRRLLH